MPTDLSNIQNSLISVSSSMTNMNSTLSTGSPSI